MNIQLNKISLLDEVVKIKAVQLVQNEQSSYKATLDMESERMPTEAFRKAMDALMPHLLLIREDVPYNNPEDIPADELKAYKMKTLNIKHSDAGYSVIMNGGKSTTGGSWVPCASFKVFVGDESPYDHWKSLKKAVNAVVKQTEKYLGGESTIVQLDIIAEPEKVEA